MRAASHLHQQSKIPLFERAQVEEGGVDSGEGIRALTRPRGYLANGPTRMYFSFFFEKERNVAGECINIYKGKKISLSLFHLLLFVIGRLWRSVCWAGWYNSKLPWLGRPLYGNQRGQGIGKRIEFEPPNQKKEKKKKRTCVSRRCAVGVLFSVPCGTGWPRVVRPFLLLFRRPTWVGSPGTGHSPVFFSPRVPLGEEERKRKHLISANDGCVPIIQQPGAGL